MTNYIYEIVECRDFEKRKVLDNWIARGYELVSVTSHGVYGTYRELYFRREVK